MMARTLHLVAYICKIGDNEREVVISIDTNNDKVYMECEHKCGRQCVFNSREYRLVSS